jgi:NADH-quinone oxidoreductase subunit H
MVIADINVGVLYVFRHRVLRRYGIVNRRLVFRIRNIRFLGGVRSSSQMISYELSLGLAVIPIFLLVGNSASPRSCAIRSENGWLIRALHRHWGDMAGNGFLAIRCSFPSSFSRSRSSRKQTGSRSICPRRNRTGRRLSHRIQLDEVRLFFLGEYAAMITGSAIIVTLFLGGWHLPFLVESRARLHWL